MVRKAVDGRFILREEQESEMDIVEMGSVHNTVFGNLKLKFLKFEKS